MKMPSAWIKKPSPKDQPTNVAAKRINMSEEVAGAGLCPDCQKKMTDAMANDHEVVACHSCRIVLPKPDSV